MVSITAGLFNGDLYPANENETFDGRQIPHSDSFEFECNRQSFVSSRLPGYYNRFMVVRKKSDSKLHFIPVKDFVTYNPHSRETSAEVEDSQPSVTYSQLTEKFGLRRQQRALNESIRANYDPELKRETMQLINETTGQKRKVDGTLLKSNTPTTQSGIQLPPYDKTTLDVRQAYDIKWLAPSIVLAELAAEAQKLIKAPADQIKYWMDEKVYPRTILNRLDLLPRTEEARLEMAERYILWHYMWKLSCLNQRQLQRKEPMPGTPPGVLKFLLSRYTQSAQSLGRTTNQLVMSPLMKNTLIIHHMIFLLSIFDYKVVASDLLEDMATSADTLKKRAIVFGGNVTSARDPKDPKRRLYTLQLTAPLNL